jgi:hypothetical protein
MTRDKELLKKDIHTKASINKRNSMGYAVDKFIDYIEEILKKLKEDEDGESDGGNFDYGALLRLFFSNKFGLKLLRDKSIGRVGYSTFAHPKFISFLTKLRFIRIIRGRCQKRAQ